VVTVLGVNVGTYQMDAGRGPGDANFIRNAEQQWARGFIDPATGQPFANIASPPTATANWVNWDQLAGEVNATSPFADNFNTEEPAAGPIPNEAIPGISIPGAGTLGDGADNIVAEVSGYMRLTRGAYRMGVNSDDGFVLAAGAGHPGPFGLVLGSFNGGRGASDTVFDFAVEAAGDYPFRLLWWEGGGGANVEWFAVNINTGERILVNHTNPNSIKTFRTGTGRAYVKSFLPAVGYTAVPKTGPIKAELVDGTTTVVDGSVTLVLDGVAVTPTIVNGATTTVTYTPSPAFANLSSHTGSLVWTESTTPPTTWTNDFSFTVVGLTPDDLPSYTQGTFWIEAEDFDGNGVDTAARAIATVMPYGGDAYTTLTATEGIDYNNDDGNDSDVYRTELDGGGANEVNIAESLGGRYGRRRPGAFDMTANYRIGWVGGPDEWYNYTRTIPNGLYTAYAALSFDGTAVGQLRGELREVTAGLGTTTQTTRNLGTFNQPGSGGWGANDMVPLKAADGSQGVFKITKHPAASTLRFYSQSGDFDWFVVVPVTGVTPKVITAAPANNAAVRRDATLSFTIEDFSTAVVQSSVRLIVDGADVTGSATITKPADITTVTYDPPGLMGIGSSHSYSLIYTDNGAPAVTQTNSANFTVHIYPTAGSFLIEAEDFNYGSGQTTNVASTMPYLGAAYTNLGAVLGVDYNDNDGRDSQPYRGSIGNGTAGQNVNHDPNATAGTLDTDRGEWSVTANYKIGWTGGGNWYNYTRTIPANTYQVWAALSFDGTTAGQLDARLERVTSDPTLPNQTVEVLGTFNAPGSGGWGANNLVQMKDSGSNPAVISLSGAQTLRFNPISGDFDYFMLVPGAPPLRLNPPTLSGGQVTISWTGTGTLQQSDSLTTPNWGTAPSQANPQTVTASGASKYYRLQQ